MNAWISGLLGASLTASLVGMGGEAIQPPAQAIPSQPRTQTLTHRRSSSSTLLTTLSTSVPETFENDAPDLRQTYEDIEIFRRLLSKSLVPFAMSNQTWNLNSIHGERFQASSSFFHRPDFPKSDPHANLDPDPLHVSGVYLPPTGIIFTAYLPGKLNTPAAKKPAATSKPMTDWDRTRRELRGEKVEPPTPPTPREQPHVLDSVLHSLAENGHNLSGLEPSQTVAVAVTFRNNWMQQCQQCHTSALAGTMDNFNSGNSVQPGTVGTGLFVSSAQPGAGRPSTSSQDPGIRNNGQPLQTMTQFSRQAGGDPNTTAQNDQALLGDLHFKQGRYDEAAAAYGKALKELPIGQVDAWAMNPASMNPELRSVVLKLIELQNRIIQCELALKQEDKVSRSFTDMKRWMAVLERIDPAAQDGKSASSNKPKSARLPLPEKLIVVASKSLLDQVGTQQITFEQFKAKVKVEFVKFD
jgi:hypothetical protein